MINIEELSKICLRHDTEIVSVTEEREYKTQKGRALPSFVRIRLVSKPSESSHIRHELWLPEDWNGIFLGTGNGGLAGVIRIEKLEFGTFRGCATAHTDMGTYDGTRRGVNCPDVHKDFGWRATYLMTVVGKQLTEAYYGRSIRHSYFVGGSTGGQQALTMAQRYPDQYEGIVAGVPVTDRNHLHAYFVWCYNKLRDTHGKPLFDAEDAPRITQKVMEYCHSIKAIPEEENFLTDSYVNYGGFIDRFIQYLAESDIGFNEAQLAALDAVYRGPVDSRTGERIYCGMPMGSESNNHGIVSFLGDKCPYFFPFTWAFGEDFRPEDFEFEEQIDVLDGALAYELNATNPDLSAFFDRGGKLFMFSGSADPCVPYPPHTAYFGRVNEVCGRDKTWAGMRYFVIPGQDHKAGVARYGKAVMNGDVVISDNLAVIRKWCEKGIDPCSFDVVTPNGGDSFVTKRIFAWE